MSWKDRFTYNTKTFIESEVEGTKFRFYPNRIGLLHDLAEVSRPVAKALAVLFDDARSDSTAITERYKEKDGGEMEKITVQAMSPEVSEHRRKERERVVDSLIEAIGDPRNRLLLGRLLMDSLRDEFPYVRERSAPDVEEFLDGGQDGRALDIPTLKDLIAGWTKANAKVFGKAGENLAGIVRGRLDNLRGNSPSSEETIPDSGSSSKTPSSLQLVSDSPSNS